VRDGRLSGDRPGLLPPVRVEWRSLTRTVQPPLAGRDEPATPSSRRKSRPTSDQVCSIFAQVKALAGVGVGRCSTVRNARSSPKSVPMIELERSVASFRTRVDRGLAAPAAVAPGRRWFRDRD
jgi:hypothetical protein